MDRRHFLFGIGALSAVIAARPALADASSRRILVVVELKGGNDGLNTVVPYADPLYRQYRPGIGVARDRVLQLDEHVGLHDKLAPLMESWKARDFAIVQGVGYPYPNRSHFRSIEIWDTASASSQTLSEGWVSHAFDGVSLPKGAGVDAIVVDTNSLPMMGSGLRTIVMQDAENFLKQAAAMKDAGDPRDDGNPALRHLLEVRHEVNAAAAGLRSQLRDGPAPAYAYGADNGFGRELDLATRLLLARVPVIAIKVALTGFDTHANQVPTQERLLGALADGLATFRKNLIAADLWKEVVVMSYSEFGRRARQNASGGTDHGTAAPQFILGGAIKGGLHGQYPSLADLQDGDLRHTVDFRNVYSTLARGCWGRPVDFGQRPARTLDLFA
ncbi:Uncharacterized conserved protein, DUF1501 family [Enhydrobacter aerosaccus]|uniref:Uncharacterized conserved protein, DUF1501 family n=1 Tax=Enhydrobacter aerosaccus TaxID=225324 RepID=A0A1T4S2E2_9HYPH|nr:DUF1501 domain-containing protein [Enhydrobacter aerosaccus]SKA22342.1 Uncharacterized conserved protein, DUF1501 family [Enhydrobacter aerosaccus]